MGKRLKENLSSGYIEAANRLRGKKARQKIVAYVESYDDVFFWRSVLSQFENEQRYFEVMLPSKMNQLERGKKAVIMNLLHGNLGRNMIACCDADYDYLIQGRTQTSRELIENPYIFHTYAYAIENLQCYAPSLHEVCVAVTLNDQQIFDCEEYLRQYSQAIFPLFIWNIWYYRTPNYKDFTMTTFCNIIEAGHFTIANAERLLQNVRRKVGKKVQQLQERNPDFRESYQQVKEDLKCLGVTADNAYLYIQGHHLFEKIVEPMVKAVCDKLTANRQQEINRQSLHNTQRMNELASYNSRVEDVKAMLKKNVGYMRAPQFKQIQNDLEQFFSEWDKQQEAKKQKNKSANDDSDTQKA